MRTVAALTAILMFLPAGPAVADMVRVGGAAYHDVAVIGGEDGQIIFRGPAGNRITKPVLTVTLLAVDANPVFSEAEQLAGKGQLAESIGKYRKALSAATGPLARLVRYRLLAAMNRLGRTDQAVEQWLVLLAESPDSPGTVALRPTRLGPKGSKVNAEAIALLEAAGKLAGQGPRRQAIEGLLLEFQRLEERAEAAGAASRTASQPAEPPRPESQPVADKQAEDRLKALSVLAGQARAADVLKEVQANMRAGKYGDSLFAQALLVAGRAERRLAADDAGPGKRKLLVDAGLDFMRVVTFFPGSPEAPLAMLEAGRVNAELGNLQAALAAFQSVIKGYPGSTAARDAQTASKEVEPKLAGQGEPAAGKGAASRSITGR